MAQFNVADFSANLNRVGTVQTNKFEVTIMPPRIFRNSPAILDIMRYRAESVRIPGVTLDNIDTRRYGHDIRQKVATNVSFNDISVTFLETDRNLITKFFYEWTDQIFGYKALSSAGLLTPGASPRLAPARVLEYKDNYIARVVIDVYNNNGQKSLTVVLEEAYPVSVGENSIGWNEHNNLYKLNVSFTYSFISVVYGNNIDQPGNADPLVAFNSPR